MERDKDYYAFPEVCRSFTTSLPSETTLGVAPTQAKKPNKNTALMIRNDREIVYLTNKLKATRRLRVLLKRNKDAAEIIELHEELYGD